jgi:hypothetical protein
MSFTNNMISLRPDETKELIALQDEVENCVHYLRSSISIRLSKILTNSPEHPELIAKSMAYWFTNLFHYFDPSVPKSPAVKNLVSTQLIIACLDIFLNFGQAISATSSNPLLASESFNKILTIRMVERQAEEASNLFHLYELCLLD